MLKWGLQVYPICMLCRSTVESWDHLFFGCSYTWTIWNSLASKRGFHSSRSWNQLLHDLNQVAGSRSHLMLLKLSWQAAIYLTWSERNSRIHRNRFKPPETILREASLIIKNMISSLRDKQHALASSLMQLWLSNWSISHYIYLLITGVLSLSTCNSCFLGIIGVVIEDKKTAGFGLLL